MNRFSKLFVILIFFIIPYFVFGQTQGLSQGEKLFKENNPEDAVQVLENEILNGQISANTYNFLGLGYFQLGAFEKSVNAFQRGIEVQPSNVKILSFNQGNSYYAMKDYNHAVASYSKSLQDDGTFYNALLNRANALLMNNQYKNARTDYITFLEKCPKDPQRPQIEEIIKLLDDELERIEEEARLAAEAEKAKWEQIDGLPTEHAVADKGPDWEPVDEIPETPKKTDTKPDWEQVETDKLKRPAVENVAEKVDEPIESEIVTDNIDLQPVVDDTSSSEYEPAPWEEIDKNKEIPESIPGESINSDDLSNNWEDLDSSDIEEMNRLEKESIEEREKYLAEQKRKQEQAELDRKLKEQMEKQKEREADQNYKDQIRREMEAAEEARRQQMLDDVANSLRKTDSENMTSGAEDIIDYEFEGELD